ncbi:preprotein translocase subunit SecE [Candidatus Marinimicrobia bacterium]|nr:preprotein translocase subunit SecE [Candidatus Neomarinimicrobiota bacterium]
MVKSISDYFKSIRVEMVKVSWLTRDQAVNSTFIVGVFAFIIAIFLFVLDIGLSEFVNILYNFI